jgi:DNA recombination protein RmuC
MNNAIVILLTVAGLAIGATLAWLVARSRIAGLEAQKCELARGLESAQTGLRQEQTETASLVAAKAAAEATLESERRATNEKLQLLTQASEEMKAQFKALASTALESNNANFLQLATLTLQNYQTQAAGELAQKELAVKSLVDPISQSLEGMNKQIQALEQARSQAYGTLTNQVLSLTETQRALHTETGNLVRALRDPQTRGQWGELQLRKVLELAGMLEYCDFQEQVSVTTEDGRLRPDVVVRLPGAKNIVIDSKTPLQRYLDALEATDEAARNVCLLDHARQFRSHMDDLAKKAYWTEFQPTPEFVLMFIPGEAFFRAAVATDPELLERGGGKVILTSPMTMIAALKTIAFGWNQKNLADSAREISKAGKTLYQRLSAMAWNFEEIGKRLGGAVDSYNKAVGSMERSVFPIARKMPDLDRSLSAADLPDLHQVEKSPRQLESPDWQLTSDPGPFSLVTDDAEEADK